MEWQTPKTNWSAEDGVRDSDFNRIEGNILYLHNTTKVLADINIYVSPNGSDETGTGASAAPYRTIAKALDMVPRNLNGKVVQVYIGEGTYAEAVSVKGFSNGKIVLTGSYGAFMEVNSFTVDSSICEVRSLVIYTTAGGVTVTNGAVFISNSRLSVSNSTEGLYVLGGSTCRIGAQLSVANTVTNALRVAGMSRCHVLNISGAGSETAIIAEEGSTVSYSSTNITVTAAIFVTRTGGRVYTGGQTSLPNY